MHAPIKYAEKGLSVAANAVWQVFSQLNKISQNPSMTPRWSDKPLLKSHQKTKPPPGLATADRLPVSDLRARSTSGHS